MIAIYLSHPFTGNEEENRRQARAYAAEIAHKRPDILIVNPLDAMQHVTDLPYLDVLEMTVELMLRCDAVVALGDWKNSKGCCTEYNVAHQHKMKWIQSIEEALQYKVKRNL